MKALTFTAIGRSKHRLTVPQKHVDSIIKQLGMPSMDNYIFTVEIKSIKSPHGVEFLV